MKVYVLTGQHSEHSSSEILGVFIKPKVARGWLDGRSGMSSKNKWHKNGDGTRYIIIGKVEYVLTEWAVMTSNNDKDNE